MTTTTPRLSLKKHTTADEFHIQDYADNWDAIDAAPGIHLCTSSTRPSWGAPHAGRWIFETDTHLAWEWNGTTWLRPLAMGYLGGTERTTDISTTVEAPTYATAVSASVPIPEGGRKVLVVASGPGAYNTADICAIALFRGATQLTAWTQNGTNAAGAATKPKPISMVTTDTPPADTHAFTIQFARVAGFGGTSTLQASATAPLEIAVIEI